MQIFTDAEKEFQELVKRVALVEATAKNTIELAFAATNSANRACVRADQAYMLANHPALITYGKPLTDTLEPAPNFREVRLTLSPREATVLRSILGRVSGSHELSEIAGALEGAGFHFSAAENSAFTGTISKRIV